MNIQWAAGFFEGEGYARWQSDKWHKRFSFTVSQVNRAPLDEFRKIMKVGSVRGPYGPYKGNRQPHYQFMAHGRKAAKAATRLLPYLLGKRAQLEAALQKQGEQDAKTFGH